MPLQYDNTASVFFGVTMLALYLVPASMYIFNRIRKHYAETEALKQKARTAAEEKKLQTLLQRPERQLWTPGFQVCVGLTCVAALLFILLAFMASGSPELAVYDPYAALGLATGASESAIKSAYRRLSRTEHPDVGGSVEKFQAIVKAYETLSDPDRRRNFELYGNPDGRQAMQISIGLPSGLTEGVGKHVLLIVYLGILVLVVPLIMYRCYAANKGKTPTGLLEVTIQWIAMRMNPRVEPAWVVESLAGAKEFAALAYEPVEQQEVQTHAVAMKSDGVMPGMSAIPQSAIPRELIALNTVLLWSHMNRRSVASPRLAAAQNTLLALVEPFIKVHTDIAVAWHFNPPQQFANPKAPADFTHSILSTLRASQMLMQAVRESSDTASLTSILPSEFAIAVTNKKTRPAHLPRINRLRDFLALSDAERATALESYLTPAAISELQRVVRDLPVVTVAATAFVVDEPHICEKDIVTVTVNLTHLNVSEGAVVPPVYSPYMLQAPRGEEWHLLLIDDRNERMVAYGKANPTGRLCSVDLKVEAPARRGKYTYKLHAICSAYMGVDEVAEVVLDVHPAPVEVKEEEHADDRAVSRVQEVYLESMMGGRVDESDTDDDGEEGDGSHDDDAATPTASAVAAASNGVADAGKKGGKNAKGKAAAPKRAAVEEDDDSFAPSILAGAGKGKKGAKKGAAPAPAAVEEVNGNGAPAADSSAPTQ